MDGLTLLLTREQKPIIQAYCYVNIGKVFEVIGQLGFVLNMKKAWAQARVKEHEFWIAS